MSKRSTLFGQYRANEDLSRITQELNSGGIDQEAISVFSGQQGLLALAEAVSDNSHKKLLIAVNAIGSSEFDKALKILQESGAENISFVK